MKKLSPALIIADDNFIADDKIEDKKIVTFCKILFFVSLASDEFKFWR